ncbi:MAG TPA: sugar ABC transporter ATP-binding protein [Pseudothermotoga sp.]|nr:sugar ABC transporter ATP-binding protein [Pseudothermotoga sp.]
MVDEAILSAKDVCMDFSSVRVLHNVDVQFEKGMVYGVVGENGAGKSTLMRILSGFLQPTRGDIFIEGHKVQLNPLKAKEYGIILIPQELNLVDSLRVYENVFLGSEVRKGFFLNRSSMIEATRRYMQQLSLRIDPQTYVSELSPAQKQMVEIVKAISKSVKILIMDEPTSSLSQEEISKLFDVIRSMKNSGITVVFISHKLKEVKVVTDSLIILRDGRKVHEGKTKELSERQIAELMIGRKIDEMYPPKLSPSNELILQVKNLTTKDGTVKNANFEVRKGEILGFYGLVGSGRTELMEAIIGVRKVDSGQILLNGKQVKIESPQDAKKLGIVYLPEDRKTAGIILSLQVFMNTTIMSLEKFSKVLLGRRREIETFRNYEKKFDIKTRTPFQLAKTLSGGNQQKVVISKLVNTGAKIFIFDEPTRGVDVNAKHQIYEIMHQMIKEYDATFVVVSSELPEIIGICNRIMVMRSGEITACISGEQISEKNLIYHATGLEEGDSYKG